MKSFVYKVGTQVAVTVTMLLLTFAPFGTLMAQADVFTTGTTPVQNTGNSSASGGIGNTSDQSTFSQGSDASLLQQSATAPISNTNANFPASTQTTGLNTITAANGNTTASTPSTATTSNPPPSTSDNLFASCSISTSFNASNCIRDVIYAFTIGIGSFFAYIAAYFFDITIQLSLNGASYGLDFISTSWTTARDLGNMAFLFILLYIAFTIIFRADTNTTKTMLATVIIVALLVNFSFFFTRVVIDAGNIISIQFYNAIPAPPISQTIQGTSNVNGVASYVSSITNTAGGTKDLTASLMTTLNVQGLLNNTSFDQTKGNFIATVLIYIAGAIVLWLLTISFVTTGIKFLLRVVMLWFLIIVSPLALISFAVPGQEGNFRRWREALVQHSFYPVVFMFVFLVLNNFANTMAKSNTLTGGVFTTTQTSGGSSTSAIGASLVALAIRLALIIAVLYIGMQQSDKISTFGSKFAGKAGSWVGDKFKSTVGLPVRLAGVGARETAGRYASNRIDTIKKNPSTTLLGRTFDKAYTKSVLAPIAGAKFGTANSFKDVSKVRETERKEMDEGNETRLANIKNRTDAQALAKLNSEWDPIEKEYSTLETRVKELEGFTGPRTPSQVTADNTEIASKKADMARLKPTMDNLRPKREQLIANMEKLGGPQIVALNGKDIEGIIKNISDKQLKAVKESLKFSNEEKEKLDRKWHEESKKAPLAESKEQIKKLSDIEKELSSLNIRLPELKSHANPGAGIPVNINLGVTKRIKKELEDALDKQEDIRDDRTQNAIVRQKATLAAKKLKKGVDNIKKLEEQVKEIPEDVGDAKPEGEFKHVGK